MSRILFVGGQSIGHIAPCVAVWRALEKKDQSINAHFICSEKDTDAEFLQKEQLPFTQFPRITISSFVPAYIRARKMLLSKKPDVIFSSGGSLGLPFCLSAHTLKIPIILYEANAVSGKANQWITKYAEKICLGFPPTNYQLQTTNSVHTGHPVRPEVTQGSRERGLQLTGLTGKKPILLILGGSQGAQTINEAVHAALPRLLQTFDIIHLTGKDKMSYDDQSGYCAYEFAHDDLPHLYACASLALSRAGAGFISELQACGIPAILVPIPDLAQDHQTKNAHAASKTGGFTVLLQKNLSTDLVEAVRALAFDTERRTVMKQALFESAKKNAANTIADLLCTTIK